MKNISVANLHVLSFGLALGVTSAVILFFLGIVAWLFDIGVDAVNVIGSVYIGYAPTLLGSVIGAFWGIIDISIDGLIFAWMYNFFMRLVNRCSHKISKG